MAKKRSKKDYNKIGFRNKDIDKFGMLSVKAGVDNNPNSTQADRIAGATMKHGGKHGGKMKKMMHGGKMSKMKKMNYPGGGKMKKSSMYPGGGRMQHD